MSMTRSAILLILVILFSTASSILPRNKEYDYISSRSCGTEDCHSQEALGNQYGKWQSTAHAGAVLTLQRRKGKEIAKSLGIEDPAKDRACLKCHTTGRGLSENTIDEGVGCEACHGPGSEYHTLENHVNLLDRERGYTKAMGHGMYPILGDDHLKKRELLCRWCHSKDRPCYPTTQKEIQRQLLPVQVIDTLKKGEMDFSHKIPRH